MKSDLKEVKKKMESLLGSFRRERQKQENSMKTGSGAELIFKSTWFAFKDMLFLLDKFAPRETKNTETESEESIASNIIDVDQKLNESQLDDTKQSASKITDVPILKRKLVHHSFNSSVTQKSKGVRANISDTRSEEAYKILKDTVANRNLRDSSTIYGEHVASKHRKYSAHTQSVVEHLIGNILFNADMRKYETVSTPSFSPTLTEHSLIMHDQHSLSIASDNNSSNTPTPSTLFELQSPSQRNDLIISTPSPSYALSQSQDNYFSEPQDTLINFINNFSTKQ